MLAAENAAAENYPNRPIKVIVPYPAGSVLDTLTRAIGDRVRPIIGQPWIVENKPGAGGGLGLESCAHSIPDGYTFCAATVDALTIIPHYDPALYERFKTLVPVTELVSGLGVVYTYADFPAKDLREFVVLARQKPGQLSYASFGAGSASQLLFEWLNKTQNTDILHIPFKGAPDALNEVLAKRIPISYAAVGLVMPHFKSGALKPLAVVDDRRSATLPEVPTIGDLGIDLPSLKVWFGLAAPHGTPSGPMMTVVRAVQAALVDPELKQQFLEPQGFRPVGSAPSEFAEKLKAESAAGAELVEKSGVKAR